MSVHIEVDPFVLSLAAGDLRDSADFAHQRGSLSGMVDDTGSGRVAGAVEHFVERWDSRRATPTSMTREGPSKTTRSTQADSSQGTSDPGLTTVPFASSHTRPVKVS